MSERTRAGHGQAGFHLARSMATADNENSTGSYDWNANPSSASIVEKEGLYRTDAPVIRYDSSEARSPMITTALWHQCHGLLSQLFFTIPMQAGAQWAPRNLPDLDGIEGLDAFVQAAVDEAFMHSPLHRHYNVSYVPSDSRLCRKRYSPTKFAQYLKVSNYTAAGTLILGANWGALPAFGPDAFQVTGCFCGWKGDGTNCFPPTIACASLGSLCPTFS